MLKATAGVGGAVVLAAMFVVLGSGGDDADAQTPPLCTSVPAAGADAAVSLSAEQLSNAATIVRVGQGMKVPPLGLVKAVATAWVESNLRNLNYGHSDSLGLFQQRPSQGWGDPTQVLDPQYAATKFYEALLALPDWQTSPPGVAEQQVQRSAYPDRYAPAELVAEQIITAARGAICGPTGGDVPGDTPGARAYNRALTQLGVPYSWGGGTEDGPSRGSAQGANTIGFDCSGLVLYAWSIAGLHLPHLAASQATYGRRVTQAELQAGDLIFFNTTGNPLSHVGIADGRGGMIHAPRTGRNVEIVDNVMTNSYWRTHYQFATRPTG